MNLFATVLTYPAPTANYRGESELNKAIIQKITDGRADYPIVSPEAMRNALREILATERYKTEFGTLCNRTRLDDEDQLAVRFEEYPNPDKYADDFLFGYLVAASGKDRKEIEKEAGRKFPFKRDSVLRMNLAKGLEPFRFNTVFTQSPMDATPREKKSKVNDTSSNLLHRETAHTAFQYPFALAGEDCKPRPKWAKALLSAVGELAGVAGNHARSLYEMAPASLVVRLTPRLVAGYKTYCFKADGDLPDVLADVLNGHYPGGEFYVGGEIVKRGLTAEQAAGLREKGATLEPDPQKLLSVVADQFLGGA